MLSTTPSRSRLPPRSRVRTMVFCPAAFRSSSKPFVLIRSAAYTFDHSQGFQRWLLGGPDKHRLVLTHTHVGDRPIVAEPKEEQVEKPRRGHKDHCHHLDGIHNRFQFCWSHVVHEFLNSDWNTTGPKERVENHESIKAKGIFFFQFSVPVEETLRLRSCFPKIDGILGVLCRNSRLWKMATND